MNALLADLAANLRGGLRAALLLRVTRADFRANPEQLAALVFLMLGLRLLLDVAYHGAEGYFNVYSLSAEITAVAALMLAALLAARLAGEPGLLLAYPVAVLALTPFLLALHGLLRWMDGGVGWLLPPAASGVLYYGLLGWYLLATLAVFLRLVARRRARGLAAYIAYLALFAACYWWLPPEDLWTARGSGAPGVDARASIADEAAFHLQPALLERDLAALEPERPGVPDIYFVGFGAYSHEDVFMKEIRVIEALFRDRFAAEGRTIALVNNPKTALEVPLASATNLAFVLRHIGGVMNAEEDLLVLYLTSHGSEDHRLAVVNWPLRLDDIDARSLRRMLDEAGIKWRVIAVSACYSGGFIEPLKDDATLVMTASAAGRQSFGCGADSDFTFFGKALFDEALRQTHSFTEAFERARKAIAGRERAGGFRPSEPQIHVGSAIASKLAEVESYLRARAAGATTARPGG